jgi:sugar lactone lactonase YvrE
MTVDTDGFLWVAFWTGSAVRRLDPSGTLSAIVQLPVSRVTSCAFGGPRLEDLYVTSARIGLSEEQLRAEPHGGGVFLVRPGPRGVRGSPFALPG